MKKRILAGMLAFTMVLSMGITGCAAKDESQEEKTPEVESQEGASDMETDDGATAAATKNTVGTFTTQDIYGEEVTQDIFADYDLTLVNLFATWCGPCIAEMPELSQLQKDLREEGVNVVAVVLDAGVGDEIDENVVATAQELASLVEAEFTFMIPDETYMNGRLMGVNAVPESFFVDNEGNIVSEAYVGARDYAAWMEIVKEELAELQEAE